MRSDISGLELMGDRMMVEPVARDMVTASGIEIADVRGSGEDRRVVCCGVVVRQGPGCSGEIGNGERVIYGGDGLREIENGDKVYGVVHESDVLGVVGGNDA